MEYGMSENDTPSTTDPTASCAESPGSDAIETTEMYETDEGVVFYDVDNPFAWLQSSSTVKLDDIA